MGSWSDPGGGGGSDAPTNPGRTALVNAMLSADRVPCCLLASRGAGGITACRVRRRDSETFRVSARPAELAAATLRSHRLRWRDFSTGGHVERLGKTRPGNANAPALRSGRLLLTGGSASFWPTLAIEGGGWSDDLAFRAPETVQVDAWHRRGFGVRSDRLGGSETGRRSLEVARSRGRGPRWAG